MEALMQLQIITPDRLMCDESVKMVEMRTAEGEIGVLPGHIPVTVMMAPGVTHITKADGSIRHIAIHDGFVEIQPDKISIMAEIAEWPEEVDLDRAKAALSRARERITNPGPDTDVARARRAWARAQLELNYLPESGKIRSHISQMMYGIFFLTEKYKMKYVKKLTILFLL